MSKRTFIALVFTISDKLKEDIAGIRRNLQDIQIKWVEFQNLHLTLSFLGDTSKEQIEKIMTRLEDLVKEYNQFPVRLRKAGSFKSFINPQVLWIGIEADEMLGYLYRDVQNLLATLGFEKDTRPFKPHLTIGRVKNYRPGHNLKTVLENQGTAINETAAAAAIVFYESTLTPEGPVYTPIRTYKLM